MMRRMSTGRAAEGAMGLVKPAVLQVHGIRTGTRVLSPSRTWQRIQLSRYSWQELLLSFSMIALMVEGVFYGYLGDLLLRWAPITIGSNAFRLYPTDALLVPLLIACGIPVVLRRRRGLNSHYIQLAVILCFLYLVGGALMGTDMYDESEVWLSALLASVFLAIVAGMMLLRVSVFAESQFEYTRMNLYVAWLAICVLGLANGIADGNQYILTDIREMILRSLIVLGVYWLARKSNVQRVELLLIKAGVFVSMGVIVSTALSLSLDGLNIFSPVYTELGLIFPYCAVLSKLLGERRPGKLIVLSFVIMTMGMISNFAKPALGGVVISILLTALLHLRVAKIGRLAGVAGVMVVSMVGFYLLTTETRWAAIRTHYEIAFMKQDTATRDLSGGRFSIWKLGVEKLREDPFLGRGFGYALSGDVLEIQRGAWVYSENIYVHNIAFKLLILYGVVGVGFLLIFLLAWFRDVMRSSGQLGIERTSILAALCSLLVMALYGEYLSNPISGTAIWVLFGMEAGLAGIHRHAGKTLPATSV